jgi:hypothetical protein
VSRWYGGIHLGPDRFKHINNCARNVLQDVSGGLGGQVEVEASKLLAQKRKRHHKKK